MTNIDKWFLSRLKGLSNFEISMQDYNTSSISLSQLRRAKELGFSDRQLAKFWGSNELAVRRLRVDANLFPVVKQIDTVAAEFPAHTNYLYLTYNGTESDLDFNDKGIMVLGSGVYRIGSSVEFDWCSVRAIRTLRENNYKTIMINYNPETVSTGTYSSRKSSNFANMLQITMRLTACTSRTSRLRQFLISTLSRTRVVASSRSAAKRQTTSPCPFTGLVSRSWVHPRR